MPIDRISQFGLPTFGTRRPPRGPPSCSWISCLSAPHGLSSRRDASSSARPLMRHESEAGGRVATFTTARHKTARKKCPLEGRPHQRSSANWSSANLKGSCGPGPENLIAEFLNRLPQPPLFSPAGAPSSPGTRPSVARSRPCRSHPAARAASAPFPSSSARAAPAGAPGAPRPCA